MAEERRMAPKIVREAIAEYKKSLGFELGLVRSGQVTYEFGYQVALALFRVNTPTERWNRAPSLIFLRTKASGYQMRSLLMTA